MTPTSHSRKTTGLAGFAFACLAVAGCSVPSSRTLVTSDAMCFHSNISAAGRSASTLREVAQDCNLVVPDFTNDFDLQRRAEMESFPYLKIEPNSAGKMTTYYCPTRKLNYERSAAHVTPGESCAPLERQAASTSKI